MVTGNNNCRKNAGLVSPATVACGALLYAVLKFRDLIFVYFLDLSAKSDCWCENFSKVVGLSFDVPCVDASAALMFLLRFRQVAYAVSTI